MMTQLTRQQVTDLLGRFDDLNLAEIIATGATPAEILEAKRWLAGEVRTLGDHQPLRPAVVTRLYDILRSEEPEDF